MRTITFCMLAVPMILLIACGQSGIKAPDAPVRLISADGHAGKEVAAFASGCFWCTEHIFEAVVGVDSAVSGYAGGTVPNPTYELVNTETTGHAESVLVYYDPAVITFEELVEVFFLSHDPTTRDRQGPDVGSSYRSILFYRNADEKVVAENALVKYQPLFDDPIVTEIRGLDKFYRAEGYHQDYIHHNPKVPYVVRVSIPRFKKFKARYEGQLKPGY